MLIVIGEKQLKTSHTLHIESKIIRFNNCLLSSLLMFECGSSPLLSANAGMGKLVKPPDLESGVLQVRVLLPVHNSFIV